ncbi:hypothetical protein Gotur_025708 [Gossypium turneri]
MDNEPTDPYGKRKIESDSQIDDYLRSLNKKFETDKDTIRIFGNNKTLLEFLVITPKI